MNPFLQRFPRRDQFIDENNVVGEILEDIECLDSVDYENNNLDLLNDDTFGDFGDSHWDPTETFMEAERLKNVAITKPRRTTTELEKFNDFDFFLKRSNDTNRPKKDLNRKKKDINKNLSPVSDLKCEPEERIWDSDVLILRNLGMFEITDDHIDLLHQKKVRLSNRFKVLTRTIERHVRCVDRNDWTCDREYFMTSTEFDKILRIQLAQVSKDPKLQNYSGKWNLYHLGIKKKPDPAEGEGVADSEGGFTTEGDDSPDNKNETTEGHGDETTVNGCDLTPSVDGEGLMGTNDSSSASGDDMTMENEHKDNGDTRENDENGEGDENKKKKSKRKKKKKDDKERKLRSHRFGKISSASIRYGRRLIHLAEIPNSPHASELENSSQESVKVDLEKEIRTRIEFCYETLYILCDVEHEIEKCPMNHVSALDKMQKDRDEYLNELYSMLTGDEELFKGVLGLNKGVNLATRIGRKLGLEQKLMLLCTVLGCVDRFYEICENVDAALQKEQNLHGLIELASNPHNLKSLVAFEGSAVECDTSSEGGRLQNILYKHNAHTKMFLFLVEGITLTGHMFLLKGKDGRHTALQRCSNILISAQKNHKGFEKILTTRAGIMFTNIFFRRIRDNAGTVDQNSVDILLHYTLDVSERIESNQADWNLLASNIVKMF